MTALALFVALWSFDRVEPPFAVMVHVDGQVVNLPLSELPAGAEPGDLLETPRGPVVADRETRRRQLAARFRRVAGLASAGPVRHRSRMARRHQDHYARRAKREGYAARSVYKLQEIHEKSGLFRPGQRVLDLGCSPGSWMQYAARAVGPRGQVVGIDRRPVPEHPPNAVALVGDIFETPPETLMGDGGPFDVVMSDMAPDTSGNRFTDHVRSIELCRRAFALAREVLRPGGAFVCKAFEGSDTADLVAEVRPHFEQFKRIKPRGTRSESVELYLVALRFRKEVDPVKTRDTDAGAAGGLRALPAAVQKVMADSGLEPSAFDGLRAELAAGRFTPERNHVRGTVEAPRAADVGRLPPPGPEREALRQRGLAALRAGEVGLVLLNGGMATRFGGCVKGVLEIDGDRSFLGLKLLDAQRAGAAAGGPAPVVILMNSRATGADTAAHLAARAHYGYPAARVWAFEQHWAPRLRPDGELFLGDDEAPSFYGPGHGDLVDGLRQSGLLARFRSQGGRVLLMSNVDNVVATLDPTVLGWHVARAEPVTVEVVDKLHGDAGGAPAQVNGRLQIVEAFRFPPGFDQTSIPVFNTNTFWFDVEALDREVPLTWFLVQKKVDGRDAIQFERLIGEITSSVDSAFLRVERTGPESRFVPVKTPEDLEAQRATLLEAWASRAERAR